MRVLLSCLYSKIILFRLATLFGYYSCPLPLPSKNLCAELILSATKYFRKQYQSLNSKEFSIQTTDYLSDNVQQLKFHLISLSSLVWPLSQVGYDNGNKSSWVSNICLSAIFRFQHLEVWTHCEIHRSAFAASAESRVRKNFELRCWDLHRIYLNKDISRCINDLFYFF